MKMGQDKHISRYGPTYCNTVANVLQAHMESLTEIQGCGSESGRIRMFFAGRIWTRIRFCIECLIRNPISIIYQLYI